MSASVHWVHDLDPVAIHLWGDFAIRWYGIAYVLAFVVALLLLRLYYRKGFSPLTPDQQTTAMLVLILGVIIGGRVGYVLLYRLQETLSDPLIIFKTWEGGMASHGGFVGVILACWWISRKMRVPFLHLGDLLATLTPPGLLLGRIANFINGELWGTISSAPWAVIFPQSAPPGTPVAMIEPRHPSQLYEAFLEGVVLLVYTQWRLWRTEARLSPGRISGEFLLIYSVVRILGEQFREPDASLILGVSRGVFYNIFLAVLGVFIIWKSRRTLPETLD